MAHEKNVGKRHGLGVTHHGSFAQPNSHKKIHDEQHKLHMRKSNSAQVH